MRTFDFFRPTGILLVTAFLFRSPIWSQDMSMVFGEVSAEELGTTPLPFEKGSEATVLFDQATARMIYSDGIRIEYTRHVRIKIFKTSGYQFANIQIPYGRLDKVLNLKASTYNLNGNKQEQFVLQKRQFFEEKVDPYHGMIRFTFPNIREGSVIEYRYTIVQNDLWTYHSMRFQRSIPVRYVEYQISFPDYFRYMFSFNQDGIIQFEQQTGDGYFNGSPVKLNFCRWYGRHLEPFEREPGMPEHDDYMLGVDFSLVSVSYPGETTSVESPTYRSLTRELLDFNIIGKQLDNTLLLSGQVKKTIHLMLRPVQKMEALYNYVRQQMNWNGYEQLWPSESLAKCWKEGTGTNAEINLILVNMLRTAGITADPVILSTRDNGPVDTRIAMAGSLNYLICCATIEGKDYLLDATDKFRPAGMLPLKCLNDQGWIMSHTRGRWVKLHNGELYETREYYDLALSGKNGLKGKAVISFSGYDAASMRRLIHEEGESGFITAATGQAGNIIISNPGFRNLDSISLPLEVNFDIQFLDVVKSADSILFFKPMTGIFGEYMNTWFREERQFPVDIACPNTENLYCRVQIPQGFRVEEIPEPIRIRMPGNSAGFSFGCDIRDNQLLITGDLRVGKVFLNPDEYPLLRDFYARLNKKRQEVIILKKIPGQELSP